jgi:hypothetical protein
MLHLATLVRGRNCGRAWNIGSPSSFGAHAVAIVYYSVLVSPGRTQGASPGGWGSADAILQTRKWPPLARRSDFPCVPPSPSVASARYGGCCTRRGELRGGGRGPWKSISATGAPAESPTATSPRAGPSRSGPSPSASRAGRTRTSGRPSSGARASSPRWSAARPRARARRRPAGAAGSGGRLPGERRGRGAPSRRAKPGGHQDRPSLGRPRAAGGEGRRAPAVR